MISSAPGPSAPDVVDRLADALTAAAEAATEPDEKNRIRAAAEFLAGAGRDLAVAVVAARIGET